MNCKIVYATKTGHSRKIAQAIADKIDVVAYDIANQDCEPVNEDLIIICSGIYGGVIAEPMKFWLENVDAAQIGNALIIMSSVTHNYERSEIKKILTEKGIHIIGEKSVQGSFLFMKFGHPKKDEIKAAVDYAEKIYNELIIQGV